MRLLVNFWHTHHARPSTLVGLWVFALVAHLGFVFANTFIADDFLQYFVLAGHPALTDLGFDVKGQAGTLGYALNHQFDFFTHHQENFQSLKQYGVLPWWISDNAQLHLWRPVTSFTHWLDYQLWPDSLVMQHVTSLAILMLAYAGLFQVYRQLSPNTSAATLACLLVAVDLSVVFPLIWLAARNALVVMAFLPLVLGALHLSQRRSIFLFAAALFYLVALLSAEAGITLGAFVFSYLVFIDERSIQQRLALLGGLLLITLGWKLGYNAMGFGSQSVGNYIDPTADPLSILMHCLTRFPVLMINNLAGVDGASVSTTTVLIGWGLFIAISYLVVRINDRYLWFWFTSAILAILPYLSLHSSAPRFSVIPHIGIAMVIAILAMTAYRDMCKPLAAKAYRGFSVLLVSVHLIIAAPLLLVANALAAFTPTFDSDRIDRVYNSFPETDIADRHVVVINSIDPFRMMFHPFRAAYKNEPFAKTVRQLVPSANGMALTRISEDVLQIDIEDGLMLYGSDVTDYLRSQGNDRSSGFFEFYGFFHDGKYAFNVGDRFSFPELDIEVTATNAQQQVTRFLVHINTQDIVWLLWDAQQKRYVETSLPETGESIPIHPAY